MRNRFVFRSLLAVSLLLLVGAATREEVLASARARATSDFADGLKPQPVSDLKLLYEPDLARGTVTIAEIEQAYRTAYRSAVAKHEQRPWWQKLTPQGGWIFGALTLLALIFSDALKRSLTGVIDALKAFAYARVAGTRMFRSIALTKYRTSVKEKYARITLPFRPDRPLNMDKVFVPLRLKSGSDAQLVDADTCIRDHGRLMVVGLPGAGKSMLLKNLAYRYSAGRGIGRDAVPVLIELSRFNDSTRSVEETITDAFARNDFPRAKVFVEAALKSGSLMVLFDGLDEVNSAKRQNVAGMITDFLEQYKECPAVITCRTAVYNNQFLNSVEMTLEVVEFTDQQVRTFLTAWGEQMPAQKSVEQLMQTLINRPSIMLLARNPLLLTIIAFLYSDTEFELPHSRSQFYATAIEVLLNQWKVTQNSYSAAQKNMVLRHLARVNQDAASESDRRTMELTVAFREIQSVLPRLNLGDDQAVPILNEIVERSGLLMLIDAGERCQFAHLTLQEFMAATALRDDPGGLVTRYTADPDAWREVVKLWCGLDVNSTKVIEEIYEHDPIVAFECLADTLSIDTDVAERIINGFCDQFGRDSRESVIRAFAAVAASNRPRGKALFQFLEGELISDDLYVRSDAATALAMTNLPAAAERLVELWEYSAAIASMGDIAIPAIVRSTNLPPANKIVLFRLIGTPAAVCAIVPYLWSPLQATIAAAAIASLLPGAGVAAALDAMQITAEQRAAPHLPMVWKPFGDHNTSSLAAIVNRAAYLIDSDLENVAEVRIDPRIATPLMVLAAEKEHFLVGRILDHFDLDSWRNSLPQRRKPAIGLFDLRTVLRVFAETDDADTNLHRARLVQQVLEGHPKLLALSRRIEERHCARLLARLLGDPKPVMSDWTTVLEPVDYTFYDGWHFRFITVLIFMLAACFFGYVLQTGLWLSIKMIVGFCLLASGVFLFWRYEDRKDFVFNVALIFGLPVAILLAFEELRDGRKWGLAALLKTLGTFFGLILAGLVGVALWVTLFGASYLFLKGITTSRTAVMVLASMVILAAALIIRGLRLDRAARNPLRDLLKVTS